MQIRQANLSDLSRLIHLHEEHYTLMRQADPRVRPFTQAFDRIIGDENAMLLTAVHHELVIGYILGWRQQCSYGPLPPDTTVIEELALDAHKYYGGLGRSLVNAFHEQAQTSRIFTLVPRYHAVEQAFWRAMGAQVSDQLQLEIPVSFLWMILQ